MTKINPLLDQIVSHLKGEKNLKALAKHLNLDYSNLNQIKNHKNKNPGGIIVAAICSHYGIAIEDSVPILHEKPKIPLQLRIENSDEVGSGQREAMIKILKKDYTGAVRVLMRLIETESSR